ncbi:hypothetical protein Tco_1003179 [Tanacetum coccineum]|uniref:Uncharacterized protein n=1 Tax=Tanacetum coccineum TaxID=301880 RepID=A0ABQ5F8C7_9ASTR
MRSAAIYAQYKTTQTDIFSCNMQTKKVEDLARLSLQNTPVYIDVDFGSYRIQARGISPPLEGKDVLGAVRTGCGTSS